MASRTSLELVEIVAKALSALSKKVVFVGGAIVELYIKDKAIREIRPTEDVDCVIEIANRSQFYDIDPELEGLGFQHDISEQAPMCRWTYEGIKVDIMPSDPAILGMRGRWYALGVERAVPFVLPSTREIMIFPLPYFIASKIEAFDDRGNKNFAFSPDIEDVVTILDGQTDFADLKVAEEPVGSFLRERFGTFLADPAFRESISAHLDRNQLIVERARRLLSFLEEFVMAGQSKGEKKEAS